MKKKLIQSFYHAEFYIYACANLQIICLSWMKKYLGVRMIVLSHSNLQRKVLQFGDNIVEISRIQSHLAFHFLCHGTEVFMTD